MRSKYKGSLLFLLAGSLVFGTSMPVSASPASGVYTVDADFDVGSMINVNHDAPNNDQLQLNDAGEAFNFIWVAVSSEGTVVKIDTETCEVLGEYLTNPQNILHMKQDNRYIYN